jgi:arylsulfatase
MAVRMGNLKAMRLNMRKGNKDWKLFDLSADIMELDDISAQHPDVIRRVEEIVAREHTPSDNPGWRFSILEERN